MTKKRPPFNDMETIDVGDTRYSGETNIRRDFLWLDMFIDFSTKKYRDEQLLIDVRVDLGTYG